MYSILSEGSTSKVIFLPVKVLILIGKGLLLLTFNVSPLLIPKLIRNSPKNNFLLLWNKSYLISLGFSIELPWICSNNSIPVLYKSVLISLTSELGYFRYITSFNCLEISIFNLFSNKFTFFKISSFFNILLFK